MYLSTLRYFFLYFKILLKQIMIQFLNQSSGLNDPGSSQLMVTYTVVYPVGAEFTDSKYRDYLK